MNILKKQGVAWVITIVMIVIAIGIGSAKAPTTPSIHDPIQTAAPDVPIPPNSESASSTLHVWDDADVLSDSEEVALSQINAKLSKEFGACIACVTTNYGRADLYDFALDYAERLNLSGIDFIVVLDISGENYWLVQGAELVDIFTDEDCGDYAWEYMEDHFARGNYGDALIELTKALYDWYQNNW